MKKGFTLIEVAIAIIVVGLIIAGVWQGRSILNTANIKKLYSDADGLYRVSQAFKLEYDCLPGDCATATDYLAATTDGNGDKEITPYESSGDIIYENMLLFEHIGLAELSPLYSKDEDCYINADTSDLKALFRNCNYPITSMNSTIFSYIYSTFPANVGSYKFFTCINTTVGCLTADTETDITSDDAMKLDSMFDDGIPLRGNILSACTSEVNEFTDLSSADLDLPYDTTLETCPIIIKL